MHLIGAGAIGQVHLRHLQAVRVLDRQLKPNTSGLKHFRVDNHEFTRSTESIVHETKIDTLIVTLRAPDTLSAISSLVERLDNPLILLLQNGVLGVHEQLQSYLLGRSIKADWLLGLTTHGASHERHSIVHRGQGMTAIGSLDALDTRKQRVLDLLNNAWQPLNCSISNNQSLLQQLTLKLGVNACINPLTTLLDCRNGGLLGNRLFEPLTLEIGHITGLDPRQLLEQTLQVCEKTKLNQNSMHKDFYQGSELELDFITGYLLRKAHEQQFHAPILQTVHNLVLHKVSLRSSDFKL
ncbi:ketopantoate reductase PanE/ApbA C terminal-domain-containing protein [Gorgonomyces haynaldii]|nr:ketopantoate reductase PanE/ApbA C terminal-domain-containing protein [Gorgonomyces haynaldii]